tara:strand:- start:239 stop:511 length:273 start_codon:yes stop_codon:yes gene_type:complete
MLLVDPIRRRHKQLVELPLGELLTVFSGVEQEIVLYVQRGADGDNHRLAEASVDRLCLYAACADRNGNSKESDAYLDQARGSDGLQPISL